MNLPLRYGNKYPGIDRARRGARGALYPKPSICGAESPPEGTGLRAERRIRGVEGRVLRGGTGVNWVRSGRKQL